MKDVKAIIRDLREANVRLSFSGEELAIEPHDTPLSDDMLQKINLHRESLIAWFRKNQQKSYSSIPAVALQESYVLSSSQRRLWLMSQLEESNAAYNIPRIYLFEGELDMSAVAAAFHSLISRHESLRTVFHESETGEIRQWILSPEATGFHLKFTDLSTANNNGQLKALIQAEVATPFDLERGPLLRASITQTAPGKWVFIYVMHHIISDGWSMGILLRELLQFYELHTGADTHAPSPLRIHYKDYAAWQQEQLSGKTGQEHQAYWLQQFDGELPVLELPGDHVRPAIKTFNGALAGRMLDASVAPGVKALAREQGATFFMSMLAAVNVLLYHHSGQTDIIIGSPVAGRDHKDLEDQIGAYINTLPLRMRFNPDWSFTQLLEYVKNTTLQAFEHQSYPLDELVGQLQLQRDRSRNPLFDVLLSVTGREREAGGGEGPGGLKISSFEGEGYQQSKFDLSFNFIETTTGLLYAGIEYNTDIYGEDTIQRLLAHLEELLGAIISTPSLPLKQLNILTAKEREQLLYTFNNTPAAPAVNSHFIQLFEARVAQCPDNIALVCGENIFTYRSLNEWVNRLAACLQEMGVTGTLVAVHLERSEWLIIALLAVLKRGAAYLSVDPEYPQERIDYMLSDSNCQLVIDENMLAGFKASSQKYSAENPVLEEDVSRLAYVLYTSGSTGKPKGVMIGLEALTDYAWNFYHTFRLTESDRVIQQSSVSFDTHVEEIYPALLAGSALLVAANGGRDVAALSVLIHEYQATVLSTTPLVISELCAANTHLHQLRLLISGGDKFSAASVANFIGQLEIFDSYGPTECTVCSTYYRVSHAGSTAIIGRPVANRSIYIVNDAGGLQPLGVTGEICISGKGLAAGYLHQPALTAEKFVTNPFLPDARMYKTCDLGRWLPDGNIEFIGRKDEQLKIRGYRIEPGEVESVLQAHPAVTAGLVTGWRNAAGRQELVAYYTGDVLNATDIRNFISVRLPAYMVPAYFIPLEVFPLTPSGKIDRRRLPEPGISAGVEYLAPRTAAEIHLAAVLEEVLKKKQVGLRDDFFLLGGDSIKSIQVVSRLKQRGYSLKIQDVLLTPEVEQLAAKMETVTRHASQEMVTGLIPFTPIQHYFLEQNTDYAHHFNQSVLLHSHVAVSEESLRAALHKLWAHHDALRMVYRQEADGWVQENKGADSAVRPKVAGYNITDAGGSLLEVLDYNATDFAAHCDRIQSSFQLSVGPLFKAALFRAADGDRLLLVAHHLVVDGVSWRILLEDLSELYQQHSSGAVLQLPPKTDAYAWWSEQLQAYAQSTALTAAPYWERISAVNVSPLPLDDAGGSNQVRDGVSQSFLLDSAVTTQLLTRCYSAYRTEVNDILLTALGLALRQEFGLSQTLVMLEGHGREDIGGGIDVTRTIGWFTTLFPVLLELEQPDAISQLITVKEHLHRVPAKGIGYGVQRYLGRKHREEAEDHGSKKEEQRPQLSFNYLGDFGTGVGSGEGTQLFSFSGDYRGVEVAPERERSTVLSVSGMIVSGQLRMTIGYSKAQYKEDTIRRLLSVFEQQLQALIAKLSASDKNYATPVDLTFKDLSRIELAALNKDGDLEDVYSLSPLQEGFYYHWLTVRGSVAYVEQMSCVIKGPLNIPALTESYAQLSARHAVLRTHFTQLTGKGVLQVVKKKIVPAFAYVDATDIEVEAFRVADRARGFDLHTGSQMRLTVLGMGNDTYEFIWSHHHTLMDGWCVGILIREFFEIYYSLLQQRAPRLDTAYPYADYISWLTRTDRPASLLYWKNYLAGYDTISSVPGTAANDNKTYLSRKSNFVIDGPLRQSVKSLCGRLGITENTFFSTVWGILLGRYNNTDDVVFGSIVSGRPAEVRGIEEMIGLFINTIPVRVRMDAGISAESLLKLVGQEAIDGVPHHYTQLADVQSASELERGLFDHILQFQNFPVQQMVAEDMERSDRASELTLLSSNVLGHNAYNFTCIIVPGEHIVFMFKYNGSIYEETQIARLQEHLTNLVAGIVENPAAPVSELAYLGISEQQQLLETFSHAVNGYPSEKNIVDLFAAQVQQTPDAPALAFNDTVLSYQELDLKSDILASYLLTEYKIMPNDRIGIMLDRSENMIIAILGILKTGGAYVAIDPDLPKARKAFIMQDTLIRALITQTDYVFELDYYNGAVYAIDIQLDDTVIPVKPTVELHPSDLAYVLYTSGSTGQPKGVMISHRSLVDYSYGVRAVTNIGSCKTFGLVSTISADLGNTVIYTSLLMGGCLRIYSAADVMSADRLSSAPVDCMKIVPSHWKALQSTDRLFAPAKCLIFGGEQLTADVVDHIREHKGSCEVYNHYGPSETTIGKLLRRIDVAAPKISLGMPFCNSRVYVLDKQLRPCPIGVAGEICIGGDGLANGYLNQPELTAARFVPNPFVRGELFYKTGDLGRWLPDGSIAFLGRKDDQVKIRGYRIELDEITDALQQHPAVDTAVVLAWDNKLGERELAAYYVSALPLDSEELRTFLSKSLPSYMLPRYYVQLESMPITSNGKINRKLLPDPETIGGRIGETYVAPENTTESQLVKIWEEVLGLTNIGVMASFFNLGGNSLKIIKMSQLVNQVFGVTFSIDRFFEYLTIRDIAQALEQQQTLSGDSDTAAPETDVIIF